MGDEMKPLDLELIRARAKRCAPVSGSTSMQVVYGDVPALVAEVERLRTRERDLETRVRELDARIVGMRRAMNDPNGVAE